MWVYWGGGGLHGVRVYVGGERLAGGRGRRRRGGERERGPCLGVEGKRKRERLRYKL